MAARKKTPKKRAAPKAPPQRARPERKIAILGTTPSRMQAPIDDPSWEIWTIGPGGKDTHRWDRLFEIHNVWPESFAEYIDDLKAVEPPQQVWTMQPLADCAANVVYPKEQILERFGKRMWFSSSISYCIALAIYEGATDIGLWGIDLESGEEYISQFVGCAHFLDVAVLLGINVHLPPACGLLRDLTPYPDRYETNLALHLQSKKEWLEQQLGTNSPQYESLKASVHRYEGHVLTARETEQPPEKIAELEEALLKQNIELNGLLGTINQLNGELGAIKHIQRMFVWGMSDPS